MSSLPCRMWLFARSTFTLRFWADTWCTGPWRGPGGSGLTVKARSAGVGTVGGSRDRGYREIDIRLVSRAASGERSWLELGLCVRCRVGSCGT
jgi:hypothetical protein